MRDSRDDRQPFYDQLVDTNEPENALAASDARKTQAPRMRDRAEVEQAVGERVVHQEAEQTIAAEAREQATSAKPPESGALTTEPPFTPNEITYLNSQRVGRLATIGPDGVPHNVPVGFHYNAALGTIDIGGHGLARSRKFRDIGRDPRVAFVVDDLAFAQGETDVDRPPWTVHGETVHGMEIRGTAEALNYGGATLGPGFDQDLIRICPRRIIAWNLDEGGQKARDVTP